jgi:phosphatidate phosphatase
MNTLKIIQEFLPIAILFPTTLLIHFVSIKPFQRGFFCDDHTLKYPYIENETIPQYICLLIWISISGATILTTQILNKSTSFKDVKRMITGLLCCILLTDITKYSVGRLRPHFLTLCNPDYDNVCFDDEEAYYSDGDEEFVNEFYQKYVNESEVCNNEKPNLLNEARLSFMSGHASFSFYCASF